MGSDCLFCKIARKEVPSRIVYEDGQCVAFEDINPQAPVHLLIVPKSHIDRLTDVTAEHKEMISYLFFILNKLAYEKGIAETGFRAVMNCGPQGGQTVSHLHLHLLGGRRMTWPPG